MFVLRKSSSAYKSLLCVPGAAQNPGHSAYVIVSLSQCASAVDNLAAFYFNISVGESPPSPAAINLARLIADCLNLFPEPADQHQRLSLCFDKLMADVTRSLDSRNRDKFTQNLTVFRHEIRVK